MGVATRYMQQLKLKNPQYQREQYRTYLTTTEWRAVEMAEEMGKFLKANTPLYRYPFFGQVATLWKILFSSIRSARQHQSLKEILLSEYGLMDIFITCFISISFIMKGSLSFLLWPWMKKQNSSEFQTWCGDKVQAYADFINKTPFYNYPYFQEKTNLWHAFKASQNKSLADYITFAIAYSEMMLRGITSYPIAYWYNQEENVEIGTIDMIVKTKNKPENLNDSMLGVSVQQFKQKLKDGEKQYYVHCRVPRYGQFEPALRHLFDHQVSLHNISGCKYIQCKVIKKQEQNLPHGMHVLYSYQNHLDSNTTVELDVPVKKLNQTLKKLDEQSIQVKYIHDF